MKIWHVGAAPNPLRVDGVSRTVWLMSTEQARLGHDVSLILDSQPTPEAVELASEVGLELVDISAGPFAYSKQIAELLRAAPPQVVHMHSVFIPRQAALARLLIQESIPYVITPHGGLAPQVLARGRLKKAIYTHLRERPRFINAAAVTLVTPAEEKAVRNYIPDYQGIVRWMPNPIDFSLLKDHRWEGLKEPRRLVFLGRFDVLVKGIDILIEIARLLPELEVDLYGTEDPKTLDWLNRLRANLPRNVSFNEPVFSKDKAEILSRASMYIQPSRWEGFPISVAECLYLGVPAAITESLDLAHLFTQHDLGLVLSLTPEQAAKQLRAALAAPARLDEWSRRGREFAINYFAPEAVASNHISLYEQVSSDSRTRTAQIVHGKQNGNGHFSDGAAGTAAVPLRRQLVPAHVRGALKQNVSRLMERSNDIFGPTTHARSIVLCYHSINHADHGLTVAPDAFREQLMTLRQMGYQFQMFGKFIDNLMRWGLERDTNVAVITFDDGYEDNFTQAAPILAELDVPATFFITSGLMQRDAAVMENFQRLVRYESDFVSAQQLRQMHAEGFEIGAHTHSHPNLARLNQTEARREITQCKRVIEDAISAPVSSFAYPFGKRHIHYTSATVDMVRESGYTGAAAVAFRAVSSRSGVRIYEIPRFFITRGDAAHQFKQKIVGHFDWLGTVQEMSPRWVKAVISPEDRY